MAPAGLCHPPPGPAGTLCASPIPPLIRLVVGTACSLSEALARTCLPCCVGGCIRGARALMRHEDMQPDQSRPSIALQRSRTLVALFKKGHYMDPFQAWPGSALPTGLCCRWREAVASHWETSHGHTFICCCI
jgi:hypothetical protein